MAHEGGIFSKYPTRNGLQHAWVGQVPRETPGGYRN